MGLLDQFAILNEMSPEERESLVEFLEESSYEDGRAIFRDHDEAAELVLVTAGDVRLEAGGHAVGELKAGAALGHASLVTIGHRACWFHSPRLFLKSAGPKLTRRNNKHTEILQS